MVANPGTARVAVYVLGDDETIQFASAELVKYLGLMQEGLAVFQEQTDAFDPAGRPGIYLGFFEDVALKAPTPGAPAFHAAAFHAAASYAPKLDDVIHIDVSGAVGVIAGLNPRSVLLGVYRFLREAGCRWVRPGPDGEFIPEMDVSEISVSLDVTPSYRYRGVCIEGAVSYENMLENIDWAPKAGLNSYFLEFMTPYTFFDRWYSHLHNKYKQPEGLTVAKVVEFKRGMEREIKRRGLVYHAVGHGWTCEPFGIPGLGWDPEEFEVSEEAAQCLAEVNGRRGLFGNVPLNTNLCYSNPQARKAVVDYAVRYALDNPQIDILHVWMADSFNNHCECRDCRDTLPSDFLVRLVNEMDAAFSRHGIDTQIALIAYLDLMWAPRHEKLNNPDRFVLLFAPITRTYSESYAIDTAGIRLAGYERNNLHFPADIRENLAYLKEWEAFFGGDAFTYEYYFMWDHYFDPAYYETARVLHEDIRKLRQIGLNGIISDQTQRSFFPTGLGMSVLAETLWDDRADFETLASDYFVAAFGEDGEACREYMATLSALFDPPYLRGDVEMWSDHSTERVVNQEAADQLGRIPEVIDAFRPIIQRNRQLSDACRAKSWEYLAYHADIASALAHALLARAEGRVENARMLWDRVEDMVQRDEDALQPVLDVFEFVETLGRKFAAPRAHAL